MNLIIVGFGSAGRHYAEILKNFKSIKKIYILDNLKIKNLDSAYTQVNIDQIINKKILLNFAIICTPTGEHFKYAKIFLNLGVNTLVEKPLVLTIKHAKELINLKKKKKTKCWVVFQNRYNFAIEKGLKILKTQKFGKPFFVDAALYWHRTKKYYSNSWRGKYKTDGGVLFNQAIHLLDILVYYFGAVKKFNAFAAFNKKKLQAEDLISLNLMHENNIITNLKATTRADRDYRMSLDVFCDKGRYLIKDISLNKIFYFNKTHLKIDKKNSEHFKRGLGPKSGMGNGHKKILKEFLNEKIKKSSKNLDIEKNLYILKLINSVYNSIFNEKSFNIVKNKDFEYKKNL